MSVLDWSAVVDQVPAVGCRMRWQPRQLLHSSAAWGATSPAATAVRRFRAAGTVGVTPWEVEALVEAPAAALHKGTVMGAAATVPGLSITCADVLL